MSGAFLKCDTAGCDHVEAVHAISPEFIDKPCPKCGASLLSERDCADWLAAVQPGIDLLKKLGVLVDKMPDDRPVEKLRIHLHGSALTVSPLKTGEAE